MNTGVMLQYHFPRNVVYCIFNFKWKRHMSIFVGEVAFDVVY